MAAKIILLICCWVCAGLFFGIGIYVQRQQEPAHFWSGTKIPRESVTDIPAYNRAQGAMWKIYSLPWWIAGAAASRSPIAAAVTIGIACVLGIPLLILAHEKIEKRYTK